MAPPPPKPNIPDPPSADALSLAPAAGPKKQSRLQQAYDALFHRKPSAKAGSPDDTNLAHDDGPGFFPPPPGVLEEVKARAAEEEVMRRRRDGDAGAVVSYAPEDTAAFVPT
ncbi:hypothetical protein HDU96_005034 [Phlyctochytrium bullatum]|nr:hypothetical protein HDU96_005034 [Phlyctochytrium bullatum]